jgi:hypothetical protein
MRSLAQLAARPARRTLGAALALAALGALGACADEPTSATPRVAPSRPALNTVAGDTPLIVTVTMLTRHTEIHGDVQRVFGIPAEPLGYFELKYRYYVPTSGFFTTATGDLFELKSLDRNYTTVGTFRRDSVAVKLQDDYVAEDGTVHDIANANYFGASNGFPIFITSGFGSNSTTILPSGPATFLDPAKGFPVGIGGINLWQTSGLDGDYVIVRSETVGRSYVIQTDADGDHVPDETDKCADTPPGTQVDADGCGGIVLPPPPPPPADTDGDGIPDGADACAATPTGSSVNSSGCTPSQTIDLQVPCAGPAGGGAWPSHGAYVAAVTLVADRLLASGVITATERGALIAGRAAAACGKTTGG